MTFLEQNNWLQQAADLAVNGQSFALATVLSVRGSAPIEVGRRILVTRQKTFGTIGGGNLEQTVCDRLKQLLIANQPHNSIQVAALSSSFGQCCGGEVVLHYEMFCHQAPQIVIFGAGHVGGMLSQLLTMLPYQTTCIDPRDEWLGKLPKHDRLRPVAMDYLDGLVDIPEQSYCLVMTHNHQLDFDLAVSLLKCKQPNYLGVIGSTSKASKLATILKRNELDASRVDCPIGLQAGKHPAEVAAAILAVLIVKVNQVSGSKEVDKQLHRLLASIAKGKKLDLTVPLTAEN